MKSKEFIRKHVIPSGGVLVKKDGDHQIFQFPNGQRMLVPVGGKHTEAKGYLESRLRKILRSA